MRAQKVAKQIKPFLDLGDGSVGSGGQITDSQAPQFLKTDGTRPLTGDLSVDAGITIDGVDISEHVDDKNAHHRALIGIKDVLNQDIFPDINDDFLRIIANDGLQSTALVNGLSISVDSTVVRTSRTIFTTGALAGGRNLAEDIAISLDIDEEALAQSNFLTVRLNTAGALIKSSNGLLINAGFGLEIEDNKLKVRPEDLAGKGLVAALFGDKIDLGLPSSLNATSTNSVGETTHSHHVEASADTGIRSELLKTDREGRTRFGDGNIDIRPFRNSVYLFSGEAIGEAAFKVTSPANTQATAIFAKKTGQVANIFETQDDDTNKLVTINAQGEMESGNPGFVSGVSGWQITAKGDAEFNNIKARGELHSSVMVFDEVHASGGTLIIREASALTDTIFIP